MLNHWGLLDYSGMRFEDFKHVGWKAFVHPDDFPETAKGFLSRNSERNFVPGRVVRLRRADGEFRWHHARCEPLRDRQGRVIQWYGLSVDIDERKQAEDRLRRSEAYLAEAQSLSHTGSFGSELSTGEVHWSDETFRILEYDPSTKPTIERALQRVHPDDVARMRRFVTRRRSGEKDFDISRRLLMPDGSVKFAHVLSRVSKDAAGNLEIAGALMDVTEIPSVPRSRRARSEIGGTDRSIASQRSLFGRSTGVEPHWFRGVQRHNDSLLVG